jgi:proteic killer suppression protein
MIISFGNKTTENIFNGISNKKTRSLPNEIIGIIQRKLDYINAAVELNDLKVPPGNRLEKLKGNLKEYHSIRINDQFRIIFIWETHGTSKVQVIDYH